MGDEESDGDESAPSETVVDDATQSTRSSRSTEEWEWVQPDDPRSDSEDEPDDGERLWEQFEGSQQDTKPGSEAFGFDVSAEDDETPLETDSPDDTDGGNGGTAGRGNPPDGESPAPLVSDTQSSETDGAPVPGSEGPGGAGIPPPPFVEGRSGDTDLPPPPVAEGQTAHSEDTSRTAITDITDITEMQPLYRHRSRGFYLLWLAAALAYGLGDMITTSYVFVTPHLGESNPFVSLILGRFGLAGFVGAKLVIFGFLVAISVKGAFDNERLSYYGPPVLAFLIGTGLTLWNLKGIFGL